MAERVFLDGAAGLPVRAEVAQRMAELYAEGIANPNGGHVEARRARALLDAARHSVAGAFGADAVQLVFTGTASEALALAFHSEARPGSLVVTSAGEHRGARTLAAKHAAAGGAVRLIPLTDEGYWVLSPELFQDIEGATALLSVASGELGTVQSLAPFIASWRAAGGGAIILDGVQRASSGSIKMNTGIDHLVVSSAKIEGPVGVAALVSARNRKLVPLVAGGGQQRGRRGGTEAVVLADAFAFALRLSQTEEAHSAAHAANLGTTFDHALGAPEQHGLRTTGPRDTTVRLPGHRSYAADWVLGDDLVAALDHEGVAVSTGSACLSGSREPSEALQACGFSTSAAQGGLRLIFSRTNTSRDPVVAAAALARVSRRIRDFGAAR